MATEAEIKAHAAEGHVDLSGVTSRLDKLEKLIEEMVSQKAVQAGSAAAAPVAKPEVPVAAPQKPVEPAPPKVAPQTAAAAATVAAAPTVAATPTVAAAPAAKPAATAATK
jgi:hypothetical protein